MRSVCTNLDFLSDVGMYVPSKIFQASQQSVKLLSSPHEHDVDGKVSPVPPGLAGAFQRALAGLHREGLVFGEGGISVGEWSWLHNQLALGAASWQC